MSATQIAGQITSSTDISAVQALGDTIPTAAEPKGGQHRISPRAGWIEQRETHRPF